MLSKTYATYSTWLNIINFSTWLYGGLFAWPNQDDRMNMTKIGEHDQEINNDEHYHGEYDQKYDKYSHNDEH